MKRIAAVANLLALAAFGLPSTGAAADPGIVVGDVEYVGTVFEEAAGAASAKRIGKHLFVGHYEHISIYDISDPEDPQRLSRTPIGFRPFSMEAIDGNSEILLVTQEIPTRVLHVYDVSDPAAPERISELPGAGDHTITCLLGCKWAYGSQPGHSIIDLRDPEDPKLVGKWSEGLNLDFVHDITEVARGRVITASRPFAYYLDARNPARPKLLAQTTNLDLSGRRILSSSQWPRKGKDRFLLITGETPLSGSCDDDSASFQTWDASRWRKMRIFTKIDELRLPNGTHADGKAALHVFGCSTSFFEHHRTFRNGGLVAVAWFEHGTRFLEVDRAGKIEEIASFLPHGGMTLQSLWVTDELVYAIDLYRGIDILRYTGKP